MSEKKADKKNERSFPSSFGRYLLLDRLAAGGMAEVFRARSANDGNRLIAIKCMLAALAHDEEFAGMFVDEAKLAAQLSHPNIVQIYELGRHKEQLYIAMELIHGKDLRALVRKAKKRNFALPKQFVAYVIAKTAEALDYAHHKTSIDGKPLKLVHRDISPQNILVGYDGEVKVVDFGIAKADQRRTVSRVGILKGKFAYMAPEQVKTGDVDGRTDLFALGAVLFETFAGRKLFYGESDFSIIENVTSGKLPESPELWQRIPPEIAPVVRRAVTVDPDGRYQEGSHMSEALEPLLISDRTFFGPKQAREVMQSLFADEIAENEHELRRFAHLTGDDVFHGRRPSQRLEPVDRRDWSIVTRDPVHAREEAERELAAHREKERERREATAGRRGAPEERHHTATSRDIGPRRKTGDPARRDSKRIATRMEDVLDDEAPEEETRLMDAVVPLPMEPAKTVASRSQARPAAAETVELVETKNDATPAAEPKPYLLWGVSGAFAFGLVVLVIVAIFQAVHEQVPGPAVSPQNVAAPLSQTDVVPVGQPEAVMPQSDAVPPIVPDPLPPTPDPLPPTSDPLPQTRYLQAPDVEEAVAEVVDDDAERAPRFGFVSVRTSDGRPATISIDKKELGAMPLVKRRLPIGEHLVRVVDARSRVRVLQVNVTALNTRVKPLELVVTP